MILNHCLLLLESIAPGKEFSSGSKLSKAILLLKHNARSGQLEIVETETGNGKWKQSTLDANEC